MKKGSLALHQLWIWEGKLTNERNFSCALVIEVHKNLQIVQYKARDLEQNELVFSEQEARAMQFPLGVPMNHCWIKLSKAMCHVHKPNNIVSALLGELPTLKHLLACTSRVKKNETR
jgi:hypothetical protein